MFDFEVEEVLCEGLHELLLDILRVELDLEGKRNWESAGDVLHEDLLVPAQPRQRPAAVLERQVKVPHLADPHSLHHLLV